MGGMINCLNCGAILHSMHRHDFQACGCKKEKDMCYVDGGFDYTRIGGFPQNFEIIAHIHQKNKEGKDEIITTNSLYASLM